VFARERATVADDTTTDAALERHAFDLIRKGYEIITAADAASDFLTAGDSMSEELRNRCSDIAEEIRESLERLKVLVSPSSCATKAGNDGDEKLRAAEIKIVGLESEIEELKQELADLCAYPGARKALNQEIEDLKFTRDTYLKPRIAELEKENAELRRQLAMEPAA
jgi:chromosome segregation ATPase